MIYGLAESGVTILVSTHYMDEAEHCDRMALMADGRLVALDTPSALKSTLPGVLLEIRGAPLTEILRALSPWHPALYGTALHIAVDRADDANVLRQALQEAGIRDATISPIVPSLEDVFLSIVANHRSFG